MRSWLRQLVPSMFRRRLLLLGALAGVGLLLLGWQMTRLTAAQHAYWSARAQAVLSDRWFVPTVRGRIVDAKGRVLAQDEGCFDVAVAYPVISGQWAYAQAYRAARRDNRAQWRGLDPRRREEIIARYQPAFDEQVETLWRELCRIGRIDRGELEERKQIVRARVEQMAADVWSARWYDQLERDDTASLAQVTRPIGEQLADHALLYDLDDAQRLEIEQRLAQANGGAASSPASRPVEEMAVWTQVAVPRAWKRALPMEKVTVPVDLSVFPGPLKKPRTIQVTVDGVALHWVGTLRDLWKEDKPAQAHPFLLPGKNTAVDAGPAVDLGGYRPGDQIGYFGVERAAEADLRGRRGEVVEYLDTEQETRTDPQPGREVRLTMDAMLQARIQAIMAPEQGLMQRQEWQAHELPPGAVVGEPLCGAAVVLEVATGRVLAGVNVPGYSLEQLRDNPAAVWGDKVNRPFLNRVVGQPYEPGSTVKPLVLAAAITDGKVGPQEIITCNGYMDEDHPDSFRCWIYKLFGHTHGPLTGAQAIAHSCNIYFYTMGQRLGGARIVQWYDRYGLGRSTGSGMTEEVVGNLPQEFADAAHTVRHEWSRDEARLLGIGQGPMRWTPLQAANAYATLARGGMWFAPTVYEIAGQPQERHPIDLGLSTVAVAQALDGLDQAVNEPYGTGNHLPSLDDELTITLPGVKVIGKSGTATAAPLRIDSDGDDRITSKDQIVRQGDHAWFICLVQRSGESQPAYVVAVVVEYAGSGGAAAGPIANQILYALRAEGYL